MARGIDGKQIEYAKTVVTISALGAASHAVEFDDEFDAAPQVMVVEDAADVLAGATYEATSIGTDGFTITITGSQKISRSAAIYWFAHEKD